MICKHLKQVSQDIIVSWVFLNPWRVKKFYEVLRTMRSLNLRAGRMVASTAPECMTLKTPFWGRKLIYLPQCVSIRAQVASKTIELWTQRHLFLHQVTHKTKRKTGVQVPKLHRIKGQPGSGQNPAPSSTGKGMPRRFSSLRTPTKTALGNPHFLHSVSVFLHSFGSPDPSRAFSVQMFNSAGIFLYFFWVSYHTYKATSPLMSSF